MTVVCSSVILHVIFVQFAHFINTVELRVQLLLCLVANAFIERQTLQIQGNTVTVSRAPSAAAAASDDGVPDEMLLRTIIVQDVSDDMEDVVCVYLENPRKNGGPIESSSYSQASKQLTICFVSQQGTH